MAASSLPDMSGTSVAAAVLLVSVLALGTLLLRVGRRAASLPPGPPTIPILGNAHLIPTTGLANKFQEWARKYGAIYSLKIFNSNIIVISDPKIVSQLLDKKGVIYSDRPPAIVPMYVTEGNHFSFEQTTSSWKLKRAITVKYLSPQMLDKHHFRVQEAE